MQLRAADVIWDGRFGLGENRIDARLAIQIKGGLRFPLLAIKWSPQRPGDKADEMEQGFDMKQVLTEKRKNNYDNTEKKDIFFSASVASRLRLVGRMVWFFFLSQRQLATCFARPHAGEGGAHGYKWGTGDSRWMTCCWTEIF